MKYRYFVAFQQRHSDGRDVLANDQLTLDSPIEQHIDIMSVEQKLRTSRNSTHIVVLNYQLLGTME
ncbi:MAG: hypothetical protein UY86_C0013G0006 [Candidatus Adlerbacteria bacterium GW2011_GWB1_54_7]|uniref:Uncharacterized protein n=1 Tax=Candidatus Adlerbacteria bacterium GW2011_GWB1_54_7 TaxID=1618607 RepID=A0A0G1Y200_9BACT|nr:MAG: hypothetical protein UY86_C0013G0006 [Candidatus Adlerbacteria bacterium GW2011_GWB1_54_7]